MIEFISAMPLWGWLIATAVIFYISFLIYCVVICYMLSDEGVYMDSFTVITITLSPVLLLFIAVLFTIKGYTIQ